MLTPVEDFLLSNLQISEDTSSTVKEIECEGLICHFLLDADNT